MTWPAFGALPIDEACCTRGRQTISNPGLEATGTTIRIESGHELFGADMAPAENVHVPE